MGSEAAVCDRVINAPIEAAWSLVSNFGGLARWSDRPFTLSLDGTGVGAVRTIQMGDSLFNETLVELDSGNHRLAYEVRVPPELEPRSGSSIALERVDQDRTRVIWSRWAAAPLSDSEIASLVERSAGRIAELERYARTPRDA